jgi:hypothetical protein
METSDLFELPNPVICRYSELNQTCDNLLSHGRRWTSIEWLDRGQYSITHASTPPNYPNPPFYSPPKIAKISHTNAPRRRFDDS